MPTPEAGARHPLAQGEYLLGGETRTRERDDIGDADCFDDAEAFPQHHDVFDAAIEELPCVGVVARFVIEPERQGGFHYHDQQQALGVVIIVG